MKYYIRGFTLLAFPEKLTLILFTFVFCATTRDIIIHMNTPITLMLLSTFLMSMSSYIIVISLCQRVLDIARELRDKEVNRDSQL